VRELRATHSTLLTDLQHAYCEVANENIALTKELAQLRSDSSGTNDDVANLQDAIQALNAVSAPYFIFQLFRSS
jgi:cell division protein FtsB